MTGQNQRPRAKPSKRSRGIATEPGAVIVPEQSPTETAQEPTPEATAMVLLHPACSAALTLNAYPNSMSGLDRSQVGLELLAQMRAVNEGDLGRGEEMLVAQAHVLDGVFNTLLQWAADRHLDVAQDLIPLALKAQNQCRATIEALDRIKNPRSYAVIHQANLANGPQQVNNSGAVEDPQSRPRENENPPIKLSEVKQIELLPDARAPALAGRIDSKVAALAKVHRAKNTRR